MKTMLSFIKYFALMGWCFLISGGSIYEVNRQIEKRMIRDIVFTKKNI